jgi:hypothetical protein
MKFGSFLEACVATLPMLLPTLQFKTIFLIMEKKIFSTTNPIAIPY